MEILLIISVILNVVLFLILYLLLKHNNSLYNYILEQKDTINNLYKIELNKLLEDSKPLAGKEYKILIDTLHKNSSKESKIKGIL